MPNYVLGGQEEFLEYRGFLGRGSYGSVHKVAPICFCMAKQQIYNTATNKVRIRRYLLLIAQSFARKVFNVIGDPESLPEHPHEATIADQLRLRDGGCRNLIKVISHGPLPTSDLYYIDMELCDFDLHNYIHDGEQYQVSTSTRFRKKRAAFDILHIVTQITTGIAFLHKHKMVHRDLKPKNSIAPFTVSLSRLTTFSTIFVL